MEELLIFYVKRVLHVTSMRISTPHRLLHLHIFHYRRPTSSVNIEVNFTLTNVADHRCIRILQLMSPTTNTTIAISRVTRVIAYESYAEGEIASWSHPVVVHTLIAITVLLIMGAIMVFLGLIEEVLNGWMGVNV